MADKSSVIAAINAITTTTADAKQVILDAESRGMGQGPDRVRFTVTQLKTALDAIDTAIAAADAEADLLA